VRGVSQQNVYDLNRATTYSDYNSNQFEMKTKNGDSNGILVPNGKASKRTTPNNSSNGLGGPIPWTVFSVLKIVSRFGII